MHARECGARCRTCARVLQIGNRSRSRLASWRAVSADLRGRVGLLEDHRRRWLEATGSRFPGTSPSPVWSATRSPQLQSHPRTRRLTHRTTEPGSAHAPAGLPWARSLTNFGDVMIAYQVFGRGPARRGHRTRRLLTWTATGPLTGFVTDLRRSRLHLYLATSAECGDGSDA